MSAGGIKALLQAAIERYGYPYGYRKLTHWLLREHGLILNPKKVYRLCREMGILNPRRRRGGLRPRRLAQQQQLGGPNELWAMVVKYGYLEPERRFFFVATILDAYDRMVVGYHIGLTCTGEDAARALLGAYERRRGEFGDKPPVARTDNGPQFLSRAFGRLC